MLTCQNSPPPLSPSFQLLKYGNGKYVRFYTGTLNVRVRCTFISHNVQGPSNRGGRILHVAQYSFSLILSLGGSEGKYSVILYIFGKEIVAPSLSYPFYPSRPSYPSLSCPSLSCLSPPSLSSPSLSSQPGPFQP